VLSAGFGKAVVFLLLQRVFLLQMYKTRATIAGSFTVAKVFRLFPSRGAGTAGNERPKETREWNRRYQ
jgi:hypothetical protein